MILKAIYSVTLKKKFFLKSWNSNSSIFQSQKGETMMNRREISLYEISFHLHTELSVWLHDSM